MQLFVPYIFATAIKHLYHLQGSKLDITQRDCDRGFLGEAEDMCGDADDTTCMLDAGKMLVAVLGHEYDPSDVPPLCQHECVFDYITGEDKKKK